MLGAIFQQFIASSLGTSLGRAPGELTQLVASTGTQSQIIAGNHLLLDGARQAFLVALNDILIVGALVAFAGALAAFGLIRGRNVLRPIQAEPRSVESAALAMGG